MEKTIKGKEFNYAGLAFDAWEGHPDKIFLNVRDTETVGELLDTLAHELVHIKKDWHNDSHGKKFQNMVNGIMIGKQYI